MCLALLLTVGCAPTGPRVAAIDPSTLPSHGRFTVLVFYARQCNCLSAHDARLLDLYARLHDRGVAFVFVDSEVDADEGRDAADVRQRGYPFPVMVDHGAKLANALGAEYATYSVVVDDAGRVRYHGGIDSDKSHLHDDATPYLADALDDLVAGRPVRAAANEGLGCALRKW
jgi:hypothetical protein